MYNSYKGQTSLIPNDQETTCTTKDSTAVATQQTKYIYIVTRQIQYIVIGGHDPTPTSVAHGTGENKCHHDFHSHSLMTPTPPAEAPDGGERFSATFEQDDLQPYEEKTTHSLNADEDNGSAQGSQKHFNCARLNRQPKHPKLAAKRRRKRENKANKKHKDRMEWDAMCEVTDSDREEINDFMNEEGLQAGLPVFHYYSLVRRAYTWATANLQEPLLALEDIENWKVRSTTPHPAVLSDPPLERCHEYFEKCWQVLAPKIQQRERCSRADAEDIAAETVGDLTCYMFGIWDEKCVAHSAATKPGVDFEDQREIGTTGENTANQTEQHTNEPGCNTTSRFDPFDPNAWRGALQSTNCRSTGVVSTPSQVLDPPVVYFECAD